MSHQLRIVFLRAKLGIIAEKSGFEPSGKDDVNPSSRHTCTEVRSKVWPEDTTTGSNIKEPEIGQMNSFGGSFLSDFDEEDL